MKSFNFSQIINYFSQVGRLIKTIILVVVLFIVAVIAIGLFLAFNPNVVAYVNGQAITQTELTQRVAFIKATAQIQGVPEETFETIPNFEQQVLEQLITEQVVLDKIASSDMPQEDLINQAQVDQMLSFFDSDENVKDTFEEYGFAREDLIQLIDDQLAVEAHVQQNINPNDVTVSDEEIDAYYQSLIEGGGSDVPAQEEIYAELKSGLETQLLQEQGLEYMRELRAQADIQIVE